ncbi:MAG TPA: hypothetical protein VIS73_13835 [Rhodocyclaceae bacterium]
MLSLDECMDFCGLDSEEVEGIAAHEHLPLIVAAELGYQMLQTTEGIAALQAMLLDNIEIARCHGESSRADEYAKIYRHFVAAHPDSPAESRAH